MTVRPLPEALRRAHRHWEARGRPAQAATLWAGGAWTAEFPEHWAFLEGLINPITREGVEAVCRHASESEEAALEGFLAAMVWGHGNRGYGPYRTRRILRVTPDAPGRLQEAALRARRDGGPAAFAWMASNRLTWLGVAFATKYLFFCAAYGSAAPAPVLDSLVQRWLATRAGWSLSLKWNVADYAAYVQSLVGWAEELEVTAGEVEYLMFEEEASRDLRSQWNDAATRADRADESREAVQEVLDALDDAEEAFSALAGGARPEDTVAFERGLGELRAIVLAPTPGAAVKNV